MTSLQIKQPTPSQPAIQFDEWTAISWAEFAKLVEQPEHQKHKAYYYNGQMRIETVPTGSDHAKAYAVLMTMTGLYCIIKAILIESLDACSYRRQEITEFQPDASYYIGENANAIPNGTRVIDLENYPLPDLVVEVSDTTLSDDIGIKRLLYEDFRIAEYWILDVQETEIIAFSISPDGTSQQIRESKKLPGLSLDLLTEALKRCKASNQSAGGAWFMSQLQSEE